MTEHHVGGVRMKGRHERPIDAGRSWRSVRTDPRRKREIISVTIRQVLLRAFLALVVGSVVTVGAVSFVQIRLALQAEIAHNMRGAAGAGGRRGGAGGGERRENGRV